MKRIVLIALMAGFIGLPGRQARAQAPESSRAAREFLMSCSYGALAGTLVGTASLAFDDQPGDKLYKIARGASLGLYTGILLGLYVVYIVPGQVDRMQERRLRDSLGLGIVPTFDPMSFKINGASLQMAVFDF